MVSFWTAPYIEDVVADSSNEMKLNMSVPDPVVRVGTTPAGQWTVGHVALKLPEFVIKTAITFG